MRILIICVTYNSYDSLHSYLLSVENAAQKSDDEISVFVADNSEQKDVTKQKKDFEKINVQYFDYPNLGYFGGAFSVLNSLGKPLDYDYVMITNVDLSLDENFFIELQKTGKNDSVGWIVPDIVSLSTNTHHNPYRVSRISRKSLDILAFLYRHPLFLYFYQRTFRHLRIRELENYRTKKEIYAGHGSCFVFSVKFMNERKFKDYPCFLFGEEIFIAEELRKLKLTTWYAPSLKVYDYDHVSTSKMKKKSYYDANLQSINFLRRTYFN